MHELIGLAGAVTALAAAAGVLWKLWRSVDAVVEGIRCQLRSDMLRTYYRHKDDKHIRQYEMENFTHSYEAYIALGGNSFIGKVHKEVCSWEIET